MKKILLSFVCMLGMGVLLSGNARAGIVYECGTWLELSATPTEDYHFVSWSDGSTDSLRQIEVNEDATFIAYFASNCEEYANWPVEALYDWLLVLNTNSISEKGYYFSTERVIWYRVVGTPDDMHNSFPQDDEQVGTGYYLTIDRDLRGTGDYYAVADVSDSKGLLCDGLMRSVIVHYASSGKQSRQMALMPNHVQRGGEMRLVGLNPDEQTEIFVFSPTGQQVEHLTVSGENSLMLIGSGVQGCYMVRVQSKSVNETLRYVVE